MNITVQRFPANKVGPDIVGNLLKTDAAGIEAGTNAINENDSPRKVISANGPKNHFLETTKLVEIIKKGSTQRGIVDLYSRSYNLQDARFTIDSSMQFEVKL